METPDFCVPWKFLRALENVFAAQAITMPLADIRRAIRGRSDALAATKETYRQRRCGAYAAEMDRRRSGRQQLRELKKRVRTWWKADSTGAVARVIVLRDNHPMIIKWGSPSWRQLGLSGVQSFLLWWGLSPAGRYL